MFLMCRVTWFVTKVTFMLLHLHKSVPNQETRCSHLQFPKMQGPETRTCMRVVILGIDPEGREWGRGPVNQGRTHSHPKGSYGVTPWGLEPIWDPLRSHTDSASQLSNFVTKERSIYPPASSLSV